MKRDIMSWNLCMKNYIKSVEVDLDKAEALKKKALRRLERARNGDFVDFIVEDYYEVIKELLTAYLAIKGLRSQNHQCLISFFLKENPDFESEAYLIQQMSFFRNRLTYYGEDIPKEFFDSKKEEFERVVNLLLKLV